VVTIARARETLTFPARFMLIAARNPCPCGYFGDPTRACSCPPASVTRYQKRLSGPILDRIDMHLNVPRVNFDKLAGAELGEGSAAIRQRVATARQRQWRRFAERSGVSANAEMRVPDVRRFCELDGSGANLLKGAVERLGLSARAFHRCLRLARTIADLAGEERISSVHIAEAVQYQPRGVEDR
jgi:magnesium chelatase family protein